MSSLGSPPGVPRQEMRAALGLLVRQFDRDSAGNGKRINELLTKDRDAFFQGAVDVLASEEESRGTQYLVSALIGNNLLLPAVCSPALKTKQAVALARAAVNCGQMVDVMLAGYLVEQAQSKGDSADPLEVQRLMEILCEISDGTRILPALMILARLPNPHVQSKAVLLIGRINRNVKWVESRLNGPDGRVRANAVEALWGTDTEEARRLLRTAGRDHNNRVAGNALLALYRLADTWCIPEIFSLASHASKQFRATGAWTMGETRDPRFTKTLARMVGEPAGLIRKCAFAALGKIKEAAAESHQAKPWRVLAQSPRPHHGTLREVYTQVLSNGGEELGVLLPTQFVLTEEEQAITHYNVAGQASPPAVAIGLIFPRTAEPAGSAFLRGTLEALDSRRAADLWSVMPYVGIDDPVQDEVWEGTGHEVLPPFTSDPAVIRTSIEEAPATRKCTNLWGTIRRAVHIENGPARCDRYLIVYSGNETEPPLAFPELASAAMASHSAVHVISRVANPRLESLCQLTQGYFHTATREEEVAEMVAQLCLKFVARYTIRYQPVSPEAKALKISIHARAGWGEVQIALT